MAGIGPDWVSSPPDAFGNTQLSNITNSVIDHYIRTRAEDQIKQNRPLLAAFNKAAKSTPGGKGLISLPVRGSYYTTVQGYELDDAVAYVQPNATRRVYYPWREHHCGIEVQHTELKADGISVVDSLAGKQTSNHSERSLVVLTGILEEKLYDMIEGYGHSMQELFWGNGAGDLKALAGVLSIVHDDPTAAGTVGGIDQTVAADAWWRNYAAVGLTGTDALTQGLQKGLRQQRRYGGNPNLFLAGSDFIDKLETEMRAKGNYTLDGFMSKGKTDAGMAELYFKGIPVEYDPYLDDASRADYGYLLDTRFLRPYNMTGEYMKRHSPARPATQYVLFRALTTTCQLVCNNRRAQGVYRYV